MRTVHETISAVRNAMNATDGPPTPITEAEIVALCDRIEQLELDLELEQEWTQYR